MLDMFDLLSPRVYVIPDSEYKSMRLKKLEQKRDLYKTCLDEVEAEIKKLVE